MENRINKLFKGLREENKKAFVTYLMTGEESLEKTKQDILRLEKMGTHLIELGVPFSDPSADGKVIQDAGIKALEKNISIKDVISLVKDIRELSEIPIVIMTYLNPVFSMGIDKFFKEASKVGVDGIIIPDLPYEEYNMIKYEVENNNVLFIPLVGLTSGRDRIEKISAMAKGFLYAVNVLSVTGENTKLTDKTNLLLDDARSISNVPVLSGFGVSSVEKINSVKKHCDGVIVGSKIIKLIQENNWDEIQNLINALN